MIQESTPTRDTQLSFATIGPILHNEPFFSQVSHVKIIEVKLDFGLSLIMGSNNLIWLNPKLS